MKAKYRCIILFQVYLSRVCFILVLKPSSKNWTQCQIKQVQKNKWRTGQKVGTLKILIRNLRCYTSARQWLECVCSCWYMTDFGRKERNSTTTYCPLKVLGVTGERLHKYKASPLFSGLLKMFLYNFQKSCFNS